MLNDLCGFLWVFKLFYSSEDLLGLVFFGFGVGSGFGVLRVSALGL